LAKHKKKKSPPTPDPDDSKKIESSESNQDTPPTEDANSQEIPDSKANQDSKEESPIVTKKIDKLFWIRVGLAVAGGIAATFIFEPIVGEERRWASIAFMIMIFIVSIGIAKGMRIPLPSSDRKKIVTTGIGSFIFIYLFMWILSYTIVNVAENPSAIPSPFP
jgi:hypothetical protein